MARRLSALLGILLIVGLLLALVWGVYRHHRATHESDEAAAIFVDGLRASSARTSV